MMSLEYINARLIRAWNECFVRINPRTNCIHFRPALTVTNFLEQNSLYRILEKNFNDSLYPIFQGNFNKYLYKILGRILMTFI